MSQLFTGAPVWVWPLLVGLIVVGVRAMRDREAPLWLIYTLPLMGVLSLNAVRGLPVGGSIWLVFVAAWIGGGLLGHWLNPAGSATNRPVWRG